MFRIAFFNQSGEKKQYAELNKIQRFVPGTNLTSCYIKTDEMTKFEILSFCANNKFSFLIENGTYCIYIPTSIIFGATYIKD